MPTGLAPGESAALPGRIAGLLLGTTIGDALGLARENLGPRRARRLFGPRPLRYGLWPGIGLVSDDTEHAVAVAEALLAAGPDPARFGSELAWRLRHWLLTIPPGVGFATLRALGKLWLGWAPDRSGVVSAGNGPAMRAPLLGAVLAGDPARRTLLVDASTLMTHRDPRATAGARVVAEAAALAARAGRPAEPASWLAAQADACGETELASALRGAAEALGAGREPAAWAEGAGLGQGVTGYIVHTVPAALFAWLHAAGDFRAAVEGAIELGGDSDTVGAITGALAGAEAGADGIPPELAGGLRDPVARRGRLVALGRALETGSAGAGGGDGADGAVGSLPVFPLRLLRSLLVLGLVLAHGLRRLLPPY